MRCDMSHSILLLEGTLSSLLLLSIPATVFLLTAAMRYHNTCARRAVSGEMDDLSVPSRRRMACDMSHIFCATGAAWLKYQNLKQIAQNRDAKIICPPSLPTTLENTKDKEIGVDFKKPRTLCRNDPVRKPELFG